MGAMMDYYIRTMYQLSQALKSRRKETGLTQKETASKVGLLTKTISHLENSPSKSSIESLIKLLAALNLDLVLQPKDLNNRNAITD